MLRTFNVPTIHMNFFHMNLSEDDLCSIASTMIDANMDASTILYTPTDIANINDLDVFNF